MKSYKKNSPSVDSMSLFIKTRRIKDLIHRLIKVISSHKPLFFFLCLSLIEKSTLKAYPSNNTDAAVRVASRRQ